MTSPKFVFYLMCLFVGKIALMTELTFSSSRHQASGFISVEAGDNLTLQCFHEGDALTRLYWFKQTLGQKPRLISNFYLFDKNGIFYDEFNNTRFTLDTGNDKSHLRITDFRISDAATYYCVSTQSDKVEFVEGVTVSVKGLGLNVQASVNQSTSEGIQPGGSVSLNCTVHTGSCDGEHSVYWFKSSEESQPGLIYTHGGRNDHCGRKANAQTHTCVYNLPLKSLNLSHAGTYYCAVASCGRVLFGNGTKLDLSNKHEVESLVVVYFLSGALTFTIVLLVSLALVVYKMNKRSSFQSSEFDARFSAPSITSVEGHREADNLHYAALSINFPSRSRRQRNNPNNECVYSSVKK